MASVKIALEGKVKGMCLSDMGEEGRLEGLLVEREVRMFFPSEVENKKPSFSNSSSRQF